MLGTFCSWIEILTIVPFFTIWFIISQGDIDNVWFRASIMLDTSRVYLTMRVIDHLTTDNFNAILHIVNILSLIIFFPAALCSFVESMDSYPYFTRDDT